MCHSTICALRGRDEGGVEGEDVIFGCLHKTEEDTERSFVENLSLRTVIIMLCFSVLNINYQARLECDNNNK